MVEKAKYDWKESVTRIVNNEGFTYSFDGYTDFEEVENKKFHTLRKQYLIDYNNLKSYINKDGNLKNKDGISVKSIIDNEGFDYGFDGYSEFEDVKDKKFHELRKKYLSSKNSLEKYFYKKQKETITDELMKSLDSDKRIPIDKFKKITGKKDLNIIEIIKGMRFEKSLLAPYYKYVN